MKIQVTKNDLGKGERGSCERCPVALAIQRTYDLKNGKNKMVVVDENGVGIWDKYYGEQHYQLPQIARDFIHSFDNYSKVVCGDFWKYFKPFSFKIGKRIRIKE
jgi:hypothetical protein